jgi:Saxitoxin biosynthesis operon protein SxtJ
MATVLEPSRPHDPPPEASDRSVGIVLAVALVIVGAFPVLHLEQPRWWVLAVAAVLGLVALVSPAVLHPISRVWLGLGKLLHKIVSPVVMGAIFFGCVTPIGWILRTRGRDVLSLRLRADLSSYWVVRDVEPPSAESMKRQF